MNFNTKAETRAFVSSLATEFREINRIKIWILTYYIIGWMTEKTTVIYKPKVYMNMKFIWKECIQQRFILLGSSN